MALSRRAAPLVVAGLLALSLASPVAAEPAGSAARVPSGSADAVASSAPAATSAALTARPARVLRHTVRHEGRAYRLVLRRVSITAPRFEVLVQGAGGRLTPRTVRPAQAYLGRVVGDPSAVAVAVRRRDGALAGQVTGDRGATVRFTGAAVTETRGLEPTTTFSWPSADDAGRNVTVRPGQAGPVTRRWDLGFDLDASYAADTLGRSVAKALDAVELVTVQLLATYERDARLRPAMRRVVLRHADAASPYAGVVGGDLGRVRTEWTRALDRDVVDNVALLHDEGGGGVAYVGTAGSNYAVGVNGGGSDVDVIRHELGHNWGPGDNHTNGPEGPTIESGNAYARFDGTELAAIFARRDTRLAEVPGRFARVPAATVALPPYAALDLRDGLRSGRAVRLRPTANDHDANGTSVSLRSVASRSHLGGRITRRDGVVTYVPPTVRSARTVDWFRYVVTDPSGRRASGVVVVRVSPA